MQTTIPCLTLGAPAFYRIRVQGALAASWSEHLDMTVEVKHDRDQHPVTILTGQVADQAALFGLLDSLYVLRFPLLSVECLAIRSYQEND